MYKITTDDDKVYTNFRGLYVPEDLEYESFTVISLLAYNSKCYLQVFVNNCKQTNDRLFWWKYYWRLGIVNAVLSLLKMLIIIVLFIALANLKQVIY